MAKLSIKVEVRPDNSGVSRHSLHDIAPLQNQELVAVVKNPKKCPLWQFINGVKGRYRQEFHKFVLYYAVS